MTNLTSLELSDPSKSPLRTGNNIELLTNLRSLITRANPRGITTSYVITILNLSHLTNLTELNTWNDENLSADSLERRYGHNYKLLKSLKLLKIANLYRYRFLDCQGIQLKFPEVRFRWRINLPNDRYEIYEGEFAKAFPLYEGKGSLWFSSGGRYEGEFLSGNIEGKGNFYYSSGSRYEGELKNSLRYGYGILFSTNGDRYDGEWKDDIKEGRGVMTYSNGNRYEGNWKCDKREGEGKFVDTQGITYKGRWKKDKKEGVGMMLYSDSGHYDGYWSNI